MRLLKRYLNYQENRLGSWMSLYPPNDSYHLLAETYWDIDALKSLLRFLNDDDQLDSKQRLKLAFEEVKKSVLKRPMFQECYRRIKQDNLHQVEKYRKEYPDGPPKHLHINMAIKDEEHPYDRHENEISRHNQCFYKAVLFEDPKCIQTSILQDSLSH